MSTRNPKTTSEIRRRYAMLVPVSVVFLLLSVGMIVLRPRNWVAWLNVVTWTCILLSTLYGRRAMRLIDNAER